MRKLHGLGLLALVLAACSGGGRGSPGPAATPAPSAAFQPASVTVHARAFDYFGTFAFTAAANGTPKPIAPADGTLACDGGYHIPLDIRSGPDQLGLVRDQYVVLPLLASPPAGTTLTCTSEWGIFGASGALLASATLDATVVYDQSGTIIDFSPSSATVRASGGNAPIFLEYTSTAGYSVKPLAPADGALACPGGYAPQTQLRAGPGKSGAIEDQLVVLTASIAPPPGTSLACTTTYALLDPTGTPVAQASLAVTVQY
jgi:hypothetical protein